MALHLIRRAARLSGADWRMLLRAIWALIWARVEYGRAPAQAIISALHDRSEARPAPRDSDQTGEIRLERLRWALSALGPRLPFRADCVVQVLAAERILVRWGLMPKFFLGVDRLAGGGLSAHVWLEVGGVRVTGGAVDSLSVMIGPDDPRPN